MTLNRPIATAMIVLTTIFWGFAFVAQKNAMSVMGPLTFLGARYVLGGLLVLPIGLYEYRRRGIALTGRQWLLIGFMSTNFFMGSVLQQTGLLETTATNAGFLTGLYVFFVPLILLALAQAKPHPVVWMSAPMVLLGLFLLGGARLDALNSGDGLIIISAVFWAVHVLMVSFVARETGLPILISTLSFLSAGAVSGIGALLFEHPTLSALQFGWVEIAYTAILSTAIGFSLQAVAQTRIPPSNAAIIMSGETLFAALGGALLLGERLAPIGYIGAAMMFAAIVLVEAIPALSQRRTAPVP